MKRRGVKDLVLAQRANMREADSRENTLRTLQDLQRKRLCALEEEMSEVRRELLHLTSHRPHYFYSTRPSSATRDPYSPAEGGQKWRHNSHLTVRIPSATRPTTAPESRQLHKRTSTSSLKMQQRVVPTSPTLHKRVSSSSLQSQQSERKGSETEIESGTVLNAGSKWKRNSAAKLGAVKRFARSHVEAKKKTDKHDICTLAELDKIKSISKWLSIQKMADQPKGIPPIAMKYIHTQNKDWKFDLGAFLEKQFPPSAKRPPETQVSTEVMEQQKKCFNNMTAARALLKFKKRLEVFRAKSDEERAAEKRWEDLRKVRYLRIPGNPTEPHIGCYGNPTEPNITPDI